MAAWLSMTLRGPMQAFSHSFALQPRSPASYARTVRRRPLPSRCFQLAEDRRSARSFFLEGVTIVVSILLALLAEAAWTFSQDRAEEREIVEQLQVEFAAAEAELARDTVVRARILRRTSRWRAARQGSMPLVPRDSVPEDVTLLLRSRFYTPSHPVLDDILSSGRFQLIRSPDLRAAILRYQQERSRIQTGEQDEMDYASQVVLPYLSSRVDLDALFSSDSVRQSAAARQIPGLLQDPEFGSLLWAKEQASSQVDLWAGELMRAIKSVQAALSSDAV